MDFLNQTDVGIANWKWLLIIAVILLSTLLMGFFKSLLARVLKAVKLRTQKEFLQDFINLKIESILAWLLISFVWHATLDAVDLPAKADKYLNLGIQIFQAYLIIRLAYKVADAIGVSLQRVASKTETTLDDQLVPLARKFMKIMVIVLGTLITLQGFGFNVVSLLAGLGLGGLALALAAQDTAANVFGSITIFLDQPFQVGHNIKIGDTEGIVEEIGFRSTRIRTSYDSVVTLPNSVVAKEKIDNLSARNSKRIRHVLGVTYDTSPERLSGFMDSIKYTLHQHKLILKDDIRVNFNNMGDFNLQILVQFFIPMGTPQEELQIQQEVLFEIMQIAQKLDVSFAFPTQTIQLQPAVASTQQSIKM